MTTDSEQRLTLKHASLIPTISNRFYQNIPYWSLGLLYVWRQISLQLQWSPKSKKNNHADRKLLFNEMWAHKPHTKRRDKKRNSNSPRATLNNLKISQLKQIKTQTIILTREKIISMAIIKLIIYHCVIIKGKSKKVYQRNPYYF